jgi:hypothetical protein
VIHELESSDLRRGARDLLITRLTVLEIAMYDLYPDWGPASHHPENPRSIEATNAALQESLDLRDNGGQRPDDN